jgi:hypothetical protein
MKKLLFSSLLTFYCLTIFAQIDWIKYSGNPVVDSTKDLTATSAYAPKVFIDGSTYHMWYTRKTGTTRENMGYMTSTNGLSWTLVDSLAIMPSTDNTRFDFKKVGHGSVIKEGDTLKMWYWGGNTSNNAGIGFAWSLNGRNWTKVDGPGVGKSVYDITMDGSGALALAAHCVIKDGSTYKMWYSRAFLNGSNVGYRIAYATSPNGLNWTNVSGSGTNGAVIELGAAGKFDEAFAFFPNVIKNGSLYQMWYAGYDNVSALREGYATSTDGISWTKIAGNKAKGACIDSGGGGSVTMVGNLYRMWYSSTNPGGFGYATSGTSTSIKSVSDLNNFHLFPNPASNLFTIQLNTDKAFKVEIMNLSGQKISEAILHNGSEIDCSLWNKGIYVLKITTEKNEVIYRKIMIENNLLLIILNNKKEVILYE